MAPIKLKYVVSFSSQDSTHKVANLLEDGSKRWLSDPQDRSGQVEAVFQLEQPCCLAYIDIGVIWCASIEVKVGKSDWPQGQKYETLVPVQVVMTPSDSRIGRGFMRTCMFSKTVFSLTAQEGQWDRIQIICRQPWRKDVQLGLSFLRIRSTDGISTVNSPRTAKCDGEENGQKKSVQAIQKHFFGKTIGEEEDPNSALKMHLQKLVASSEGGSDDAKALPRIAHMVLVANQNSPQSMPPGLKDKGQHMYSSSVAQQKTPELQQEVSQFLTTLNISKDDLDTVCISDLRHKFEKLKWRKLTGDEKCVFYSCCQEFIGSLFDETETPSQTSAADDTVNTTPAKGDPSVKRGALFKVNCEVSARRNDLPSKSRLVSTEAGKRPESNQRSKTSFNFNAGKSLPTNQGPNQSPASVKIPLKVHGGKVPATVHTMSKSPAVVKTPLGVHAGKATAVHTPSKSPASEKTPLKFHVNAGTASTTPAGKITAPSVPNKCLVGGVPSKKVVNGANLSKSPAGDTPGKPSVTTGKVTQTASANLESIKHGSVSTALLNKLIKKDPILRNISATCTTHDKISESVKTFTSGFVPALGVATQMLTTPGNAGVLSASSVQEGQELTPAQVTKHGQGRQRKTAKPRGSTNALQTDYTLMSSPETLTPAKRPKIGSSEESDDDLIQLVDQAISSVEGWLSARQERRGHRSRGGGRGRRRRGGKKSQPWLEEDDALPDLDLPDLSLPDLAAEIGSTPRGGRKRGSGHKRGTGTRGRGRQAASTIQPENTSQPSSSLDFGISLTPSSVNATRNSSNANSFEELTIDEDVAFVECPLCSEMFPSDSVNLHASFCCT